MKYILAAVAVFALTSTSGAATKYPPGTSASAIAVDQQVKFDIVGTPGIEYCQFINTKTGKCYWLWSTNAGGGASGNGGGGPN